eukprot:GHVP01016112.1.p1 GENE.GHVP01016112.1~~GHVP01016112.1.p1  ORF type:complete len:119 (+),score=0.34 GHVP01016112.1:139-495(+)
MVSLTFRLLIVTISRKVLRLEITLKQRINSENVALTHDKLGKCTPAIRDSELHDANGKLISNLALKNRLHLPIAELEMKVARFGHILKKRCKAITIHIDSMVVKRCLAGEASSISVTT